MSWEKKSLASLGNIQTGSTPSTLEERFWGREIPFVTPAELDQRAPICSTPRALSDEGGRESRLISKDAVLVCCIGSLGKIGIAGQLLATNQQINSIEFNSEVIWPKFGFYACKRLKSTLITMAPATTIAIVNKSKFGQLEIPVPPLPVQRRIAAILDQADAVRAMRRDALKELNNLRQSIFLEMFDAALRSAVRFELGDLIEGFRYGTSNKSGEAGYPALRIPNITSGSLDLTELKTVAVTDAEFQRLKLLDGDLLFVRTNGNPDNVGRCTVFSPLAVSATRYDSGKFIYASYLIRARLKNNTLLPVVLQEYLSAGEGRQALRARCKTSAGQFNINTEGLGTLPIPNFPLSLQESFVTRMQAIERLQVVHRASLGKLDALFTSIEHRAFTGQL